MTRYKLNRVSLEPDKYGFHIKIEMVTKYENGKYIKHVPINQKVVDLISNSFIEANELESN